MSLADFSAVQPLSSHWALQNVFILASHFNKLCCVLYAASKIFLCRKEVHAKENDEVIILSRYFSRISSDDIML